MFDLSTHRLRAALFIGLLGFAPAVLGACADPVETTMDASVPDAGGPAVDAGPPPPGPRHILQQTNLAPAAQSASAGDYRIRGHLRSSQTRGATNAEHRLRGGFVPLTP
jgi:hypothetical protein